MNIGHNANSQRRRKLVAAVATNVLEWYDFGLDGHFAPIIARPFFPSEDKLAFRGGGSTTELSFRRYSGLPVSG
jgi:hypothetical protein